MFLHVEKIWIMRGGGYDHENGRLGPCMDVQRIDKVDAS